MLFSFLWLLFACSCLLNLHLRTHTLEHICERAHTHMHNNNNNNNNTNNSKKTQTAVEL